MKLTWIGHSCFKIEKDGYSIVLDPYEDGSVPGYAPISETADRVFCSHEHHDHDNRAGVRLLKRPGFPFQVETIGTYHDDQKGKLRGNNKIHIISDGEARVAHLGDLGCELTPEQKEQLKNLDAVMIPVGGHFTIDAKQAAALIEELQPRITIPMHYRDDKAGFGFDVLGTVDAFTQAMGGAVAIGKSTLDTAETFPSRVVILQPTNAEKG